MSETPMEKPKKKSVALSGVNAGTTAVCTVGHSGNDLHYRGYDILELAEKATFEEVSFLLVHGDEFDQVTRYHRWVAMLGDMAYNGLVRANIWLSWVRRRLGRSGYWSLAGYAKRKVKTALQFIFDFERAVIHHARERGLDGVVCGHIHWAAVKEVDGLVYINCGDWVDSCTAIVEHFDGRLELVDWGGARAASVSQLGLPELEALPERKAA